MKVHRIDRSNSAIMFSDASEIMNRVIEDLPDDDCYSVATKLLTENPTYRFKQAGTYPHHLPNP